ncbi:MAG TPA: DUF711 family protein, partial [Candidatus Angelobacter sp.]|nr:DUF711 family protein [Candidatus Angelobacter sp.]
MLKRFAITLLFLLLTSSIGFAQVPATNAAQPETRPQTQPKIRAITAFVRLNRATYQAQVAEAMKMLHAAKDTFTKAGYEVETLRITTQPFPDYTKGMTPEQALEFFKTYDKLAQQEGFTPDIGPAMSKDSDDPRQAELLARILAETQNINGFVVVADDAGIHWNGVRAAAQVIKYLEDHTEHSEGNFHFAAGAFPPPVAPFFPVSHTSDSGHGFAIGMESAN